MDWSSGRAVGRCQTQRAGQSAESCPREQGGWQQREPLPLGLVLWAGRRMGFTQHSHPYGLPRVPAMLHHLPHRLCKCWILEALIFSVNNNQKRVKRCIHGVVCHHFTPFSVFTGKLVVLLYIGPFICWWGLTGHGVSLEGDEDVLESEKGAVVQLCECTNTMDLYTSKWLILYCVNFISKHLRV